MLVASAAPERSSVALMARLNASLHLALPRGAISPSGSGSFPAVAN